MMNVVALDPGGTTGVATWDGEIVHAFEMDQKRHHRELYTYLNKLAPTALVVENFTWTTTPAALYSVEYIGVCELYAQHRPGMKYVLQGREYKQFWDNNKIKALGLWLPGKPHAVDAIRHLLYYITVPMNNSLFVHQLRVESR